MLLENLKAKFKDGIKKLSGRKDFLEAVCAACALVASADGVITDEEIKMTADVIANNQQLGSAFKASEISRVSDAMLKRAQTGRSGRMGLYKEIEDVAADPAMGEMVYLCALDVAEAGDGEIGPQEKEALNQIAKRCNVNQAAMLV